MDSTNNNNNATALLFRAKAAKGLTFASIAQSLGKDEVWVAAAFFGQAKFSPDELVKLVNVLDLGSQDKNFLKADFGNEQWWPDRGTAMAQALPPRDPVIYRLYEAVLVYGAPIKAIIHEKFGDGIMSMIDCKIHVEKKPDPKGDRVLLTFDGKFLPYATW